MEEKQETMLERQAKMRERAKFLKEKREKERLEYVDQKLDERWRQVTNRGHNPRDRQKWRERKREGWRTIDLDRIKE